MSCDKLEDFTLLAEADLTGFSVDIVFRNEPIFVAGRYCKYSRTLSQTPWILNGVALFESSVQEKIENGFKSLIGYDSFKFSSSGREDVDVRMLGNGRPFLVQINNPRFLTNDADRITKVQQAINSDTKDIQVRDLQIVDKVESQKFLKEGEQDKTKTYEAICCLSRPVTDQDFETLKTINDLVVTQRTPIRVLHRRTLMERPKVIHKLSGERVTAPDLPDNKHIDSLDQLLKLHLVTEAGTYIKEFVHSDFGRTQPSLASILNDVSSADIIALDVTVSQISTNNRFIQTVIHFQEIDLPWPPYIDART